MTRAITFVSQVCDRMTVEQQVMREMSFESIRGMHGRTFAWQDASRTDQGGFGLLSKQDVGQWAVPCRERRLEVGVCVLHGCRGRTRVGVKGSRMRAKQVGFRALPAADHDDS